jgi:hypothetical protein
MPELRLFLLALPIHNAVHELPPCPGLPIETATQLSFRPIGMLYRHAAVMFSQRKNVYDCINGLG